MIQFYINSRPVPKAIARHRVQEANPTTSPQQIEKKIKEALSDDPQALQFLRAYGVEIQKNET
jgi:hypothetical protein